MSDSIINYVRGDKLINKSCQFCNSNENITTFGIIVDKKIDGDHFNHFGICKKHLETLNKFLTGEENLNEFMSSDKTLVNRGIRFRC